MRALIYFAFAGLKSKHQSHYVVFREPVFHNCTIALYRQVKFERSDTNNLAVANKALRQLLQFVVTSPAATNGKQTAKTTTVEIDDEEDFMD